MTHRRAEAPFCQRIGARLTGADGISRDSGHAIRIRYGN